MQNIIQNMSLRPRAAEAIYTFRTLLIVGGVCILLADILLLMAGNFGMAVCYQVLLGIGNGLFNGIAFAMLPDVTDYTEWKTGVALPGMISATATFAMKMGGAAATLLASQVLVWAQYSDVLPVQSDFTLLMLRISLPFSRVVHSRGPDPDRPAKEVSRRRSAGTGESDLRPAQNLS